MVHGRPTRCWIILYTMAQPGFVIISQMVDNGLTGFWDTLYTTGQPGVVINGGMVDDGLTRCWNALYTTSQPSLSIISHMVYRIENQSLAMIQNFGHIFCIHGKAIQPPK